MTNITWLTQRLALGTAQFGLAYGINNKYGQPPLATVIEVLTEARAAGLMMLDTAAAYGDSEARLGKLDTSDFEMVTKISVGSPAEVDKQLNASLIRLRRKSVYGVLFHSFGPLCEQLAAWKALQEARAKGQTKRIGVSLYHPFEAEWILTKNLDVDLVQLPYSVLDQRFEQLLPKLTERGIEVHIRSAFLQGLLLCEPAILPPFFQPLAPKLAQMRVVAAAAAVPLPALLLLFAATAPGVARVVIGVDSAINLRENLSAAAYLSRAEAWRPALATLAEATDTFILPYTWPPRL